MRLVTEATGAWINEIPERIRSNYPEIRDANFWQLFEACRNYSMLHISGFLNLYNSVRYIKANQLPGDFVECGCFLGGASIFMSLLRDQLGLEDKTIWLFDSFEGFPNNEKDRLIPNGVEMTSIRYDNFQESVRRNFQEVNPGCKNLVFVQGFVEKTIPATNIGAISLLRLDTDFYLSTKAELEGLYSRLVRGGVLIVDDYGVFEGAQHATDEFFSGLQSPPMLNRIDQAVWAGVKP